MKECSYCNRCYEDSLNCCPHDGATLTETLPGGCLIEGKYQLESCVGRGGMGAVYRATHIHLKRPFAIKTILPEFANQDPKAADRFLQEAQSAGAIQHPNVVSITDFGITPQGLFYYVMEYIEGRTLRDLLRKNGAINPEKIHRIFKQILSGIAAAHQFHLAHRDLKPSNIMLTKVVDAAEDNFKLIIPITDETENEKSDENEVAKVVDFGLAEFVNDTYARRMEANDGALIGSPLYMSPEQCDGAQVDERSDIYSLGIILYQMLSGEVPFKGDNLSAILTGHLLKDPPSLRELKPEISERVERMVLKALAKKPSLRYQSVAEFAEEFEAAMALYILESKTVTLAVLTVPPACEVYVDDEYRGRTNVEGKLVVKALPPGNHKVRVTYTGFMEWSNNFTASAGEFRVEARLQRKEDLAMAAAVAASTAKNASNIAKQRTARRPSGSLDSYASSDNVILGESSYAGKASEISFFDIILAAITIVLTTAMVAISHPLDPISAAITESTKMPIDSVAGILATLSAIGFTVTMILADQSQTYRGSNIISTIYGLSTLGFLIIIIIPFAIAFPIKFFTASSNAPPAYWFLMRAIAMGAAFLLQNRIRRRRRVPFIG